MILSWKLYTIVPYMTEMHGISNSAGIPARFEEFFKVKYSAGFLVMKRIEFQLIVVHCANSFN